MPRFKSHKDYAIKITHPEFGDFYFSYIKDYDNYIFTKNLKNVTTWKTLNSIEKNIIEIIEHMNRYSPVKILLSFGKNIDDNFKSRMIVSMKRYFFSIESATTMIDINKAQKYINENTLLSDVEFIKQSIIDNKHIDKHFNSYISKLRDDITQYTKYYNFLKEFEFKKDCALLEIVDASYGFRRLKLKTLKNAKTDE